MEYFQYYVEGEDEEKLINVLKSDMQCIVAGKVHILNPVTEKNNCYAITGNSPYI